MKTCGRDNVEGASPAVKARCQSRRGGNVVIFFVRGKKDVMFSERAIDEVEQFSSIR